ncbi:spermine synthase-like [Hyalella azteca]|uniref:Spermine synthase-like n=1 Tax=Hyalella azteca TaxID=294128 RepID=A0A8B7NY43_HYAAZ|nr:spermine synthase-like [Hyalella azteca]
MAGHSIPIDLRVEPSKVKDEESRKELLRKLVPLVEPYAGPLSEVNNAVLPGNNYHSLYTADSGNTFSVKLYGNGLVSGLFEHYTEDVNKQLIAVDEALQLEKRIMKACGALKVKVLAGIKRAPPINPYYTSSDDRLLEYDIDEVKFSETTPYQKVEIVHSKSFGNILVLDNLQNLAESDLAYTHGLMNKGVESYEGKTVLILGGGDGALMHELLQECPKHVLMVDIDEAVMRCCKKYLRNACGSTLDSFKGDNYEAIGMQCTEALDMFEKKLAAVSVGVQDITRTARFVPSFMENWGFIQATRRPLP